MTTVSGSGDGSGLARARERAMVRRLPLFALCWLGSTMVWTGVLSAESLLSSAGAAAVLGLALALLAATIASCRRLLGTGRVLVAAVAATILLGVSAIAVFLLVGGHADFLAFVLLTLYLSSSLFFGWGWRAALVLLVATVVPWLLALPRLHTQVPTVELVGAIFVGSALSVGIAEGYARNFRASFRHERERDAVRVREHAALAEAEAATRAKDRFIAMLSHELRSPLGAALNWAYLLRQTQLDEAGTARALDHVERSIRLGVRLIEDLLDISRITTGKLHFEMGPVDLPGVVTAVVETARSSAEQKRVTIIVHSPDDPLPVHGDAMRLRQVVENVLSNALKFTAPAGEITVDLREANGYAELTVSDTGSGIPAEVLPYIFEPFRQADTETTRQHRGLGLGLAIVRHLVAAHGGTVEAESEGEGRGTTLRVRLPLAREYDQAPRTTGDRRPDLSRSLDHLRILVVDDEAQARDFVAALLARCGADVVPAASVGEALVQFEATPPDVLVADIAMPDEDGYSLIRKVRAGEVRRGGRVPAIALTALASAEDRRRAIDAGFDLHLPKPAEPADLVAAVARLAEVAVTSR